MRLLLLLAAAPLVLGACGGESTKDSAVPVSATARVAVKDFVFAPEEITVRKGGTVTWTNEDDFDHSVAIPDLEIDGPKFGPQTAPASYSQRFTKTGTYPYMCGVHNSMTGTVIVTT